MNEANKSKSDTNSLWKCLYTGQKSLPHLFWVGKYCHLGAAPSLMDGPCPIHAQLALVEVLSCLSSTLFMLEGQLQEGKMNYIFYRSSDIFWFLKILNTWRMKKLSVGEKNRYLSRFNFIVHNTVRHLCCRSNFSKISHQTSHLFITIVGARWQYFPMWNKRGINQFWQDQPTFSLLFHWRMHYHTFCKNLKIYQCNDGITPLITATATRHSSPEKSLVPFSHSQHHKRLMATHVTRLVTHDVMLHYIFIITWYCDGNISGDLWWLALPIS